MQLYNLAIVICVCTSVLCEARRAGYRANGQQDASSYTGEWAVEVRGGREEADHIALQHGFKNLGHVR